jgi:long-chain acyl-CoA synthetase
MAEHPWYSHYESGVPHELDFQDLTIPDFLERTVRDFPDSPALVFMNCRLSWRQMNEEVERFATALHNLGAVKGTRVAIQLPNLPQTAIAFMAVQRIGAHAVLTNPLYMPPEIVHQWNDSNCEIAIVADFVYDQKVRGIRDKVQVREYIIASIAEYLRFPLRQLAPLKLKKMDPPMAAKIAPEQGVHHFRKLIAATPASPPTVEVSMEDTAVIQYTGGTTGVSKGAVLTHRNLSCNAQQLTSWFLDLDPGKEVMLTAIPMFHIFGISIGLVWPVSVAACVVLQANPRDIPMLVKNISKEKVTLFPGVPALFNAINQYPGVEGMDLSSVKSCFSGSAPLPEDVQNRFEELTGARITEGFGLTETSPVVSANPLVGLRKVGSIGIPMPSTEIRIVDADDGITVQATGEAGELIVKGPQIMQGYWGRPDETANMVRNDWLYTGDLATMDEDGFLRIVGRKKDMILASGYNVYPDEIDRVLTAHPKVFESCTIGVPDPKRGETVRAFVAPMPGVEVTADELEAWCRENLAAYKVPRTWEFRDELPKSTMMKLLRRVLREEAIEKAREHGQELEDERTGGEVSS